MLRSRVLVITLLCGAVALLVLWLTRAERRAVAVGEHGEQAEVGSAPDERAVELQEPGMPVLEVEKSAEVSDGAARRTPLDDRAPISGHVVVAGGFPAGEDVKVRAEVYLGRVNTGNTQNLTAPVARDGSFELRVPRTARYALLDLESRMLEVRDPVRVSPGATDVVLRPTVYGVITGTVLLPLGVASSPSAWDAVKISVTPSSEEAEENISNERAPKTAALLAAQTVQPDTDGAFEIAFVPVGRTLDLRVRHPAGPEWSQKLEALAPAEVRKVSIALERGGTIAGHVGDEHGQPVEGASASAFGRNAPSEARTDATGAFELTGLARGTIELVVSAPVFARSAHVSVDTSAGDVRDLEVSLARGGCIEGTVRWPDGRPARFFGLTASGSTSFEQTQGHEGHFRLCGLLEGRYEITAHAEGEGVTGNVSVQAVQTGEGALELTFEATVSFTLRGTAVDEQANPLSDFAVEVESRSGFWMSCDGSRGDFTMRGVPAGAMKVRVEARGHSASEQNVVVGSGSPGPLRFVLGPGAQVRGQVLDARGHPLAGARVENQNGRSRFDDGANSTDAQGAFTLVTTSGIATLVATMKGQAPSEPVDVEVTSGASVEGVVLRLRDTCRLNGIVLAADGKPASGVSISVGVLGATTHVETNVRGAFVADDLPPGSFEVTACDEGGARATATVMLAHGQPSSVELRFAKRDPVRVHGKVTKNGKPIACHLHVFSQGFTRSTSTAPDGTFELELQARGAWHGASWVGSAWPDPATDDVRRFELTIPDKDEYTLELALESLPRASSFDEIWR